MLDGADNNTTNNDYINGSAYNIAPPPDAIAEFKMETSNYSAEIGRGHAAVINATTKSGTNAIHGDLWEYVRNTDLRRAGLDPGPRLDACGVPHESIWRYPGRADHQEPAVLLWRHSGSALRAGANPSTYTVPTPRERQGDFTELLNPTWTQWFLSDGAVRAQHQHRHVHVQQQRRIRPGADRHAAAVRQLRNTHTTAIPSPPARMSSARRNSIRSPRNLLRLTPAPTTLPPASPISA